MEGVSKVQYLSSPRSGSVSWAGETLPVPGGKNVVAQLRGLWLEKIQAKGRTTDAEIDEAVRAILDLVCTHIGVEREQRDGSVKMVRAEVLVAYVSDRTGEEVTIERDPLTHEARIVGETPEEGAGLIGENDEDTPGEDPAPLDPAGASAASQEASELAAQAAAREAAKEKASAADPTRRPPSRRRPR